MSQNVPHASWTKVNKFNFHGKRCLLTFKGHLDKGKLYDYLGHLDDIDLYRIWHETGPETGYLHTHVQLRYTKQRNIKQPRHWDYLDIHPNFQPINTDIHWKNVCGYNKIKDNASPDPDEYRNFDPVKCVGNLAPTIARIMKKRTFNEVLLSPDTADFACKNMNYAEAVFNSKPLEPFKFDHEFHKWQLDILDIYRSEPDRHIHWFYSTEGSVGKTVFCDWLCCQYNGYPFANGTGIKDAMNIYLNDPTNLIIIDCPREIENFNYGMFEAFKRRVQCHGKYRGKRMRVDLPHVFVFANYPPRSDLLDPLVDRYIVHEIGGL